VSARRAVAAAALVAGILGFALPVSAADAPVALKPQHAIAKDIAAFPRLIATDAAAQRINRALDRLDKTVQAAVKDCRANVDKPGDADFSRQIWVTMRGPAYLGFLVSDNADCGGAHPNAGDMVLVYDLGSGAPVNWQKLLPKAMVQGTSTDSAIDGTTVAFVTSKTLQSLYLKAAAAKNPIDPDCKDTLNDPELKLSLWPDPKGGGLAIEPGDLIHAVQACGDSVVIPTATLRPLGVNTGLLDAIDSAHAGGFFDKDEP
jgi:hypothetical protein